MTKQTQDFDLYCDSSIAILTPLSEAANDWTAEHLPKPMRCAGGIVIEPRYLEGILAGLTDDGLTLGRQTHVNVPRLPGNF